VEMSRDSIVLLGCRGSEVRGCLGWEWEFDVPAARDRCNWLRRTATNPTSIIHDWASDTGLWMGGPLALWYPGRGSGYD